MDDDNTHCCYCGDPLTDEEIEASNAEAESDPGSLPMCNDCANDEVMDVA